MLNTKVAGFKKRRKKLQAEGQAGGQSQGHHRTSLFKLCNFCTEVF